MLEQRIQKLETEVAELKRANGETKRDWFLAVSGSFKDDPEFAEIVRLGKEIRQADQPRDGE